MQLITSFRLNHHYLPRPPVAFERQAFPKSLSAGSDSVIRFSAQPRDVLWNSPRRQQLTRIFESIQESLNFEPWESPKTSKAELIEGILQPLNTLIDQVVSNRPATADEQEDASGNYLIRVFEPIVEAYTALPENAQTNVIGLLISHPKLLNPNFSNRSTPKCQNLITWENSLPR